ncbi:hypothetical protein ES703_87603 [subsurface metagenome]
MIKLDKKTQTFLSSKLLCICPLCKKYIYGKDIEIVKIEPSKVKRWPITVVHCHSNKNYPIHALTLYIDANFSIRSRDVSQYLKIQT